MNYEEPLDFGGEEEPSILKSTFENSKVYNFCSAIINHIGTTESFNNDFALRVLENIFYYAFNQELQDGEEVINSTIDEYKHTLEESGFLLFWFTKGE